ncbi:MAG: hypothetical protein HW414_1541, partial [Dehalococcoidia bacterium]|nr:hypothetical protein [Dehalococcoidia bacterium]
EVAIGPTTAVQAMASGRQAARSIVQYLEGKPFTPAAAEAEALADVRAEVLNEVKKVPRVEVPALTVEQRAGNFNPMEQGYGIEHGVGESRRCLNCGAGAYIIDDKCCACLTCVRICPYNVPVLSVLGDVVIRADQCQACGLCVNECPARAIAFTMPGVEDIPERVQNALRRASVKSKGPAIVSFVCTYNLSGLAYSAPDNLALVAVPCLAKIGTLHLLKALELGADGVLLLGCGDQACQYKNAMDWTKLRLEAARKVLADVGLDPNRLAMHEISRPAGQQLAGLVQELSKSVVS